MLARAKFRELTQRSGVDTRANRALVAQIRRLQGEAGSASTKKTCYGCLMAVGFVGAAAALIGAVATNGTDSETQGLCILGIVAGLVLGIVLIPLYGAVAKRLAGLQAQIAAKTETAWKQMEPLNRLYTWDVTVKLIEATVPRLAFDPYFTADRLASLHRQFGWDDSFNDGKSIIFAQSGEINGNPFVFGHYLDMAWGEKTYEGSKEISWTEWEEDADGKRRRVRRYETLYAHVTKPIPVYDEQKLLIYGNDAAPNLSFSRQPSGLTGKDGGLWSAIRKKWRLSRLKAYSRNLDDDSNFTLMGNHEFETWFHAKDRDHEVEFRLLFTPVAQAQMLNLMKDTTVGYGDDFTFIKQKKVNVLFSQHLNAATIDTDPSRFHNWDYVRRSPSSFSSTSATSRTPTSRWRRFLRSRSTSRCGRTRTSGKTFSGARRPRFGSMRPSPTTTARTSSRIRAASPAASSRRAWSGGRAAKARSPSPRTVIAGWSGLIMKRCTAGTASGTRCPFRG